MKKEQDMTGGAEAVRPARSGRPAGRDARTVADDIMRAAEECLRVQSPKDISLAEIAEMAGTNKAMISYYFGNKDGLLIEVVDRQFRQIKKGIDRIRADTACGTVEDPTRTMISYITRAYYERPALGQILNYELAHEGSAVRHHFQRNWSNKVRDMMSEMIVSGIARGYYRSDVDVVGMVEIIRSIIFFPLSMRPYMSLVGSKQDFFVDESWLDLVCEVVDSYLCVRDRCMPPPG